MNVINTKNNNIIKKSNDLIKAKGSLSGTAQKMLSMIISMIKMSDTDLQEYALNINSYFQEIDVKSKNHDFIKEQAKELMKNPFEINGDIFNWCSKVATKQIEGYIVFNIHRDLKPYLLELRSNFTQYHIVNVLKLRGDYTPRLYEYFLMRWKSYKSEYNKKYGKIPNTYTFTINLNDFKDLIGLKNKKYLYADIKKRILEVGKKQFKEHTDMKFDFDVKKLGRKVTDLIFILQDNNKGSNDYLSDIKSFISFMRKNFVNKEIWIGQGMVLSICPLGKIYDKTTLRDYDKENALKVWNIWYDLAKNDELSILRYND